MSEKIAFGYETKEKGDNDFESKPEKVSIQERKEVEKNLEKQAERARQAIEEENNRLEKEKMVQEASESDRDKVALPSSNTEFNDNTYDQQLKQIRKQLKPSEKIGSKVIHQTLIDGLSEAGAKSLFRASGLLGGGIASAAGSLLYLLFTIKTGISYNYFVVIVLFIAGYIVGLLIELLSQFKQKN